jgi:hypothetical protein
VTPASAWRPALAAGLLALAGCGSSHERHPVPTATATPAPTQTGDTGGGAHCGGLTTATVQHLSGAGQVTAQDLAPDRGTRRFCGTAFVDGSGGLVVQVKAAAGSAADLRHTARFASTSAGGARAERIRPLAGFGAGAWLVGHRVIGFRRGGRVVTVETGFDSAGRLSVPVARLKAVARAAARGI